VPMADSVLRDHDGSDKPWFRGKDHVSRWECGGRAERQQRLAKTVVSPCTQS